MNKAIYTKELDALVKDGNDYIYTCDCGNGWITRLATNGAAVQSDIDGENEQPLSASNRKLAWNSFESIPDSIIPAWRKAEIWREFK